MINEQQPSVQPAALPEEAPAEALRVGVVGIGWAGQQHLKAYHALDGVSIVSLAGMEQELRDSLQAEYAIPNAFADWKDMLDHGGLDAVSVAVPTFLHAPITIAALERGIHVLSEKPIARNAVEGQAMVDAARKAGRVLDVAFNHRRRGDIQALKGVIDAGGLGRPYYAKASWLRRSGIPTLGSWFTNPELAGGGPLADIGVHALDYALHLLGEPKVVAVSAATHSELGPQGRGGGSAYSALASSHAFDVEDFASAFLRLEGGGTLVIEASWATYRETDDLLDFTIYGTDGGAELKVQGAPFPPVGQLRVFTDKDGESADYVPPVLPGRAHDAVVEDFVTAVRGGEAVWGGHDGSLALYRAQIIDACYQSALEQREVRL
ncbi:MULTISPECIES: Gfo/Idh/MocA family protein [Micrococcaceae]|uniref:Gfo/Idh/MocA family protein n=1 Tax=Micrococcaceae TaxID=1268 RepID=UPI002B05DE6A|nr:Gfo/Idh/MocA family oxidoreductase [Pseudarthrobacter sp. C1]MEA3551406.1 Gfo/Idh/MocA family oxidoreductase [Pseudarthrobacter sp. C1]HET7783654.1 Gfo/Idh/MocA family oxidoreductase [Arthrobacter sp.]